MSSMRGSPHRATPCRCRACPRHAKRDAQSECAAASCKNLKRALAAEAEVRRLRALCEAVCHLSHPEPLRKKSRVSADAAKKKLARDASVVPSTKRACLSGCGAKNDAEQLTVFRCSNLLYIQSSCRNVFADGNSLEDVVKQLVNQEKNPLEDSFFLLDVVEWEAPSVP